LRLQGALDDGGISNLQQVINAVVNRAAVLLIVCGRSVPVNSGLLITRHSFV